MIFSPTTFVAILLSIMYIPSALGAERTASNGDDLAKLLSPVRKGGTYFTPGDTITLAYDDTDTGDAISYKQYMGVKVTDTDVATTAFMLDPEVSVSIVCGSVDPSKKCELTGEGKVQLLKITRMLNTDFQDRKDVRCFTNYTAAAADEFRRRLVAEEGCSGSSAPPDDTFRRLEDEAPYNGILL